MTRASSMCISKWHFVPPAKCSFTEHICRERREKKRAEKRREKREEKRREKRKERKEKSEKSREIGKREK